MRVDIAPGSVYECGTDRIRSEAIPQLIIGLVYLLIITRFIWPLQLPLSIKIVAAALVLVALQYHRWSKLSSGSVFSPEFPRPVVALFNWAIGALVLLTLLQLLLDVGLLIAIPFHGIAGVPDGVRYGLAALAAVAAAIGVQQAMRVPPLKDVEVAIRGLPPQFDGYTILQLTDLHISRLFPESWARAVVARSNQLGVDLIAITGDLIDGTLDARRADIEPLRDLKAIPDGVYVISRNYEYIFGYSTWMAHYAALGLRSLENKSIVLERNGGKLVLAGITDKASRHRGHHVRDLAAVLAGAPKGVPVILLDHQPSDARHSAALGVALQLSGHTHGGLILGIDRLAARANAGFVSGRYDVDGMTLYVNNGTAPWICTAARAPLRVDTDHACQAGAA